MGRTQHFLGDPVAPVPSIERAELQEFGLNRSGDLVSLIVRGNLAHVWCSFNLDTGITSQVYGKFPKEYVDQLLHHELGVLEELGTTTGDTLRAAKMDMQSGLLSRLALDRLLDEGAVDSFEGDDAVALFDKAYDSRPAEFKISVPQRVAREVFGFSKRIYAMSTAEVYHALLQQVRGINYLSPEAAKQAVYTDAYQLHLTDVENNNYNELQDLYLLASDGS